MQIISNDNVHGTLIFDTGIAPLDDNLDIPLHHTEVANIVLVISFLLLMLCIPDVDIKVTYVRTRRIIVLRS